MASSLCCHQYWRSNDKMVPYFVYNSKLIIFSSDGHISSSLMILLAVTSGFRARIMSLVLGRSAGFSDVQQQNNWITGLVIQSAAWNLAGRGGLVPNAAKYSSVSQEPSSSSSVLSPVSPSSSLSVRETKFIPQQCTCGLFWKYKKQGSLKAPATGKNHCLVVTEVLNTHSECLFERDVISTEDI